MGGVDPALFNANSIILDLDFEGVNDAGMGEPDAGGEAGGGTLGEVGKAGASGMVGVDGAGCGAARGAGGGGGGGAPFLAKILEAMERAGGVGAAEGAGRKRGKRNQLQKILY